MAGRHWYGAESQSIKLRLASDASLERQENRPKIRVRLNGQGNGHTPPQLPPTAAEAPEPLPPKVVAFWNFDEDARPWDKGSGEIWGRQFLLLLPAVDVASREM